MDTVSRIQNVGFAYDPTISGYDTNFWKTISGSPAVSSNKIRLNAAEIATHSFYEGGVYRFNVTVPAAPTSGDSRAWGLKTPAFGNRSRIEFNISGAVFTVVFYDKDGTAASSKTITWDAAWTNAAAVYEIRVAEQTIEWWINNVRVHQYAFNIAPNRKRMTEPAAIHVVNSNADNMDITYIVVRDVHTFLSLKTGGSGGGGAEVVTDSSAFTEASSSVAAAGWLVDDTSTDTAPEGSITIARVSSRRAVMTSLDTSLDDTNDSVNAVPKAKASATMWSRLVAAVTTLSNTATAVKASAGQLGGWSFRNTHTSDTFIQLFNVAAGSVTLGTTVPTMVLPIPANNGINQEFLTMGITFDTAITAACTATRTGSGAPGVAAEVNAVIGI